MRTNVAIAALIYPMVQAVIFGLGFLALRAIWREDDGDEPDDGEDEAEGADAPEAGFDVPPTEPPGDATAERADTPPATKDSAQPATLDASAGGDR